MSVAPSRTQFLSLYRQYIRSANNFTNYNFRKYFLRKARTSFENGSKLNNSHELDEFWLEAHKELAVLKRQAVVSQMYTFDQLVVEPLGKKQA
ncbi:LAMI_0G12508g1_1 [Lachancea mirantina]|uniref:LAMI_0G12508g1_1 n=1 Tax=Lachancea mirantina TaxID=1230905 RepID=A0A1G4KBD8_9SACH|nr:LAMI_0G12508g1_1 [Lachancea mirantina]